MRYDIASIFISDTIRGVCRSSLGRRAGPAPNSLSTSRISIAAKRYPVEPESLPSRLTAALEDRYLRAASFTTAASWGIADEVAKTTGLPAPTTVLNVFPWSDRVGLPASRPRPSNAALSLYWFSQIVSLDRGLQDAIRALGSAREPVTLAIRGVATTEVKSKLLTLARSCGAEERITFLPLIHPDGLLASAGDHDVGLCLEVPDNTQQRRLHHQ